MDSKQKDIDLTEYLSRKFGASDLDILKMSRVEQGMSSDTFFIDLQYTKNEKTVTEEIVLKREPAGGILETYDLEREFNYETRTLSQFTEYADIALMILDDAVTNR